MISRRALLLTVLLLPLLAVRTGRLVSSASKERTSPLQTVAAQAAPAAVAPVSASEAVASLPASDSTPCTTLPEFVHSPGFVETAETSPLAVLFAGAESTLPAATGAPVAPPMPRVLVKSTASPSSKPAKPTASKSAKSTAAKNTACASAKNTRHATPPPSVAASASKPSVTAIPPSAPAPSLYDRSTAQAPDSGFLSWFGPKASGVHYDARMLNAAQIAEDRARHHSVQSCWRYVKEALLRANVVDTYPQTSLAKQAGDELIKKHGFRRLSISDPFKAPVGSVLVYGGRGAGHVEIRTKGGFVSDFESPTPSKRPLLGIFVKPS